MDKHPSKEALALASAISSSGLTHEAVGEHVGVTAGQVSHWVTGRRPVPVERAEKLATYLGIAPERICARYARLTKTGSGVALVSHAGTKGDERRHDLIVARLENDVDALRYAMGALVSAMVIHRPAEASDVARVLRKHVPAKFVNHGFVAELLKALDKGA